MRSHVLHTWGLQINDVVFVSQHKQAKHIVCTKNDSSAVDVSNKCMQDWRKMILTTETLHKDIFKQYLNDLQYIFQPLIYIDTYIKALLKMTEHINLTIKEFKEISWNLTEWFYSLSKCLSLWHCITLWQLLTCWLLLDLGPFNQTFKHTCSYAVISDTCWTCLPHPQHLWSYYTMALHK